MAAFKGAVKVGAHAIETDIHLTKDGVVVLSHVSADTDPLYVVTSAVLTHLRTLP